MRIHLNFYACMYKTDFKKHRPTPIPTRSYYKNKTQRTPTPSPNPYTKANRTNPSLSASCAV